MRSAILGVGHYVPTKVVTNDDLARLMPTSDEWIQQRTGIKERRFIEHDGIGASDLAVPAVQMALERAGRKVSDVDMIIFATLSPDHFFPGSGCFLGEKLGLPGVPALDIRNQCSGFLYGLSVADAWVRTGAYKNILVVGAEVHSTGVEFTERGRDVAVLFGDGAGAALVGPSPSDDRGLISIHLHADGTGAKDLWIPAPASKHIPRITHKMLDEGEQYPKMIGKQVFRWATEKMPEVSREALAAAGIDISSIDLFVPHQANMRINQYVADKLGLPQEKVVHNIERYGNTTAATIPIGLSESVAEGRIKEGTTVLTAAFGSGYTWGAAVLRW
ncbi:3-oxoacyl-ACP synthase III family protein [Polyangium jinanense]|uniref:Beta-ketoacyl-[acyl-carrier-protein] synthase III n=1 Tax=Polyangium jinanense TaxID=2829994 RepID=A0A9X3X6L7_9BACT|nr:beta-ketoacyl-ACP synthase III [Polyangium jinanense]MDC3959400.1 ketoacyl-ACP synthase III [Polyangium jinanense]MDC3984834.1 ketoacyl-ACP synthase III [Polyangium jinanense]